MTDYENATPKCAIAHARVSTVKQAEFSIDRQLEQIAIFAAEKGIEIVGEERLEGVSGLEVNECADVERIIKRKVDRDDFDAIILADVDRLTRAGVAHGFHVMHMLNEAGIQVLFARHDIPPGPYGWFFFALKCADANTDIKTITKRMLEGWMKAAAGRRVIHSNITPFACDKLISNAAGVPQFRVRRCRDKSYKVLEPDSETVIRVIAKSSAGSVVQIKTQRSDLTTLVPGDPDDVETVREIFELRFGPKGWGSQRIAKHLNIVGRKPPSGSIWTKKMAENIYCHSYYLGETVGNVMTAAKLLMRGTGVTGLKPPRQVKIGKARQKLKGAKFVFRDPDQWRKFEYPEMSGMLDNLPADVRAKGLTDMIAKLEQQAQSQRANRTPAKDAAGRASGGSPHKASDYILGGLLRCELDNTVPYLSNGTYYKGTGKNYRYYVHRGRRDLALPGVFVPKLPAVKLEKAVLSVIAPLIQSDPELRSQIVAAIEQVRQDRESFDPALLERLTRRESELLRQIEKMTLINSDMQAEHLRAMIDPLKRELRDVAVAVKEAEAVLARSSSTNIDVEATTDRVLNRLNSMLTGGEDGTEDRNLHLKALLKLLVKKLTIHPDTCEINLVVGVPRWFLKSIAAAEDGSELRPVPLSSSYDGHETNTEMIEIRRFSGFLHRAERKRYPIRWSHVTLGPAA